MDNLNLFNALPIPVFQSTNGNISWANEAFKNVFPDYCVNISELELFAQPAISPADDACSVTVLALPEGTYLVRPFMADNAQLYCMTLVAASPPDSYSQIDAVAQKMRAPLMSMQLAFDRFVTKLGEFCSDSELSQLESMAQNYYRLARLVTNVSNLAELNGDGNVYPLSDCDIAEICRSIIKDARPFVEARGISLIFEDTDKPLFISANSVLVERAIYNLISNAVIAQTQGLGRVSSPGGAVRLSLQVSNGFLMISVDDNGPGFDDRSYARAFSFINEDNDPASLTRTSFGLPLVAAIARHMGGCVMITNKTPCPRVVLSLPNTTTGRLKETENIYTSKVSGAKMELSDLPVGNEGLYLPAAVKKTL